MQVANLVGLRQELAFQDFRYLGLVGGVAEIDFKMAHGAAVAIDVGSESAG